MCYMKAGDWDCFCFRWFVMIVIVECGVGFVATDVVLSLDVVLLVLSPLVWCCLWMWCCGVGNGAVC